MTQQDTTATNIYNGQYAADLSTYDIAVAACNGLQTCIDTATAKRATSDAAALSVEVTATANAAAQDTACNTNAKSKQTTNDTIAQNAEILTDQTAGTTRSTARGLADLAFNTCEVAANQKLSLCLAACPQG